MTDFLSLFSQAALTSLGFFWKAGWAFVLGYTISAMIQVFVPKARLTKQLGDVSFRSVALSTGFGSISSSCSFAALAAARSLVMKGAHFIVAVAFMFASTNLVIELGILIFIFLGWQFLVAEIIGGLLLIAISSLLIKATYPTAWLQEARDKVQDNSDDDEQNFDWRDRIASRDGWMMVGHKFVMDWQMVWKEILIGFTIAGLVATFVPAHWWATIFMVDVDASIPGWVVAIENAMIAPFIAAATFIGSMGNIPLATVLHANGVLFTGLMAFIYSDLMVPPLVAVNAKYYGWRVALYIAGIMYISIVITALVLNGVFTLFDVIPESQRAIDNIVQFKIDYTFWLNIGFAALALALLFLNHQHNREHGHISHDMDGDGPLKVGAAITAGCFLGLGLLTAVATGSV